MDGKERTIRKEVHLAKTSPHRDRGWETDYPQVGSGSRNLGFAKRTANRVYPARVWLANNVQVLRDVTHCYTFGTLYPDPARTLQSLLKTFLLLFLWEIYILTISACLQLSTSF